MVTDILADRFAIQPGLLSKLMAAVRPEFRADELVFDPVNPVFGGVLCRVSGCGCDAATSVFTRTADRRSAD
jgi:hypothetical protein